MLLTPGRRRTFRTPHPPPSSGGLARPPATDLWARTGGPHAVAHPAPPRRILRRLIRRATPGRDAAARPCRCSEGDARKAKARVRGPRRAAGSPRSTAPPPRSVSPRPKARGPTEQPRGRGRRPALSEPSGGAAGLGRQDKPRWRAGARGGLWRAVLSLSFDLLRFEGFVRHVSMRLWLEPHFQLLY